MNKSVAFKCLGYFLGAFSAYLIYRQLKNVDLNWDHIYNSTQGSDYFLMLVALLVYVVVMYIGAWVWSFLVNDLSRISRNLNVKALILVHAKSNVGKYLPGNFMQFVGRNLMANKLGYRHSAIILATALEVLFSVVVGVALIFFIHVNKWAQVNILNNVILDLGNFEWLIVMIMVATLVAFLFRKKMFALVAEYKNVFYNKSLIILVFLSYCLAYLLMGLCNILIFFVLNDSVVSSDFFNFLIIYLISWILGFIIPGPPGGIGVRELIYISFLSLHYDIAIVSLTALILRIINIVGDVLYFVISVLIFDENNRRENKTKSKSGMGHE